uniref:YTH domain-containing family protein n=1 Tax=Oryza rufipogon TaxID=4529 RepID=A0A0E0PHV6_ORYRU
MGRAHATAVCFASPRHATRAPLAASTAGASSPARVSTTIITGDEGRGGSYRDAFRDRFKVLKNHAMQEDINPCFFYAVTGYFDYRAENRPRHKESAASSILGEIPKPLRYTHLVGGQQDRDSLKRQTADCSMSLGESSSIPKIARSILGEIPKPLRYTHQYNWADLAVVYEEAIFFVLQAYNEEVIHLSMRYDMLWTCSAGNHALDDAFRLAHQICAQKNCKCPIILFLKIMILKLGFTGSLTVPNVLVGMQTLPVEKKAGSSCSPAMNSKGEEDSSKLEEPKASKTPEYRIGSLIVPNVLNETQTLPVEKKAGSSCSHALNSKGKEESSGRLGKEPQASRANNPVLLSTPKSRSQGIKHKPQTGEKAASSRCSTAFNSKRGEDSSGCSSVSVPIGAMMINVNLLD